MRRKTDSIKNVYILIALAALVAFAGQASAQSTYRIEGESFLVDGRTKAESLSAILGNPEGLSFRSFEELQAFISARGHKLESLRTFRSQSVRTILGEPKATDGGETIIPVRIEVSVTDGSPFIVFPFGFYNSNEGFMGGLIANAPNVGGSLEDVMLMGMYNAAPDGDDDLQWADPNFVALGTWSGIRLEPLSLALTLMASKITRKVEDRGLELMRYGSLTFQGSIGLTLPLSGLVSDTLKFRLAGSPTESIEYCDDPDLLAYGPIESAWSVENELSFKDFRWKGNFREGWQAKIVGEWSHLRPAYASPRSDLMGRVEAAGYAILGTRVNPQARIYAFVNGGLPVLNAASDIRGIRNGELKGNAGAFLNTSVQVLLFRVSGVEFHVVPCLDAAYAYTPDDGERTHDWGLGAGLEILALFDAMKNLPIKLGFAYDLRPDDRINGDKAYEVDFSFRLSY